MLFKYTTCSVCEHTCACLLDCHCYCEKDDLTWVKIKAWRWGSNQQQKCIPFNDQPPLNLFSHEEAKGCSKIWETALFFRDCTANPNCLCHFLQLVISVIKWFQKASSLRQCKYNNSLNQNCSNLEILAGMIHAKIFNLCVCVCVCLLDKSLHAGPLFSSLTSNAYSRGHVSGAERVFWHTKKNLTQIHTTHTGTKKKTTTKK